MRRIWTCTYGRICEHRWRWTAVLCQKRRRWLPSLFDRPDPQPMSRTRETAAAVAKCDRVAASALRLCTDVINAALFIAVWLVLRWARLRSVAMADRSGIRWNPPRFHCAWCGCDTPENERWSRSCCAMAAFEDRRRGHA